MKYIDTGILLPYYFDLFLVEDISEIQIYMITQIHLCLLIISHFSLFFLGFGISAYQAASTRSFQDGLFLSSPSGRLALLEEPRQVLLLRGTRRGAARRLLDCLAIHPLARGEGEVSQLTRMPRDTTGRSA